MLNRVLFFSIVSGIVLFGFTVCIFFIKAFFQKSTSYQKVLIQASKGMVLITDIPRLLNIIVYMIKKHVKVKNTCIFQYDEELDSFILKCYRGGNKALIEHRIGNNSTLVNFLKNNKKPFLYRDIRRMVKYKLIKKGRYDIDVLTRLKEEMKNLECELCVPSFWKGKLLGFLILGERLSGEPYSKEEINLLSTLANDAGIAIENARNFIELEKLRESEKERYFQTVLALARTVDEKDTYTRGHLDAVTKYGIEVGQELADSTGIKINIEELKTALLLHDIGKIGIPDALLNKNGSLTPEEWSIMKQHCEIGERILEPIEKLKNVGRIIRYHQEKYDGTGYPDGLKGEDIPLEARIIAVVDAYHAMVSDRPYRKALSEEMALKELKDNKGTQFDSMVVDAFFKAWEKGKIKE